VYGQEALLPVEVNMQMCRITEQGALSVEEYSEAMMSKLDEVPDSRFKALCEIEKEKMQVAKAYNKRVREKSFQIGELIWKIILPVGMRNNRFGKWSPSWEGPLWIVGIVPGNTYFVETLEGYKLPKTLNGRYLKKY
jgi:hypothetical protein